MAQSIHAKNTVGTEFIVIPFNGDVVVAYASNGYTVTTITATGTVNVASIAHAIAGAITTGMFLPRLS